MRPKLAPAKPRLFVLAACRLNRGQPAAELRGHVEGFISQMEAELAKKATTQPPTEAAGTSTSAPDTTAESTADKASNAQLVAPERSDAATTSSLTEARKLAIAGWSIGAVSIGVAVGLEMSARSKYDGAKAETMSQDRRDELEHSANHRRTSAIVLGGIGVAAIAGSTILWFTSEPSEQQLALAPRIERDSAGLVLSGRF